MQKPDGLWAILNVIKDFYETGIDGRDNTHVQINNGAGVFNALATANNKPYKGQLVIMI